MFAKKIIIGAMVASLLGVCAATAETIYKVGSTTTGNPFTFLDVNTNKIDGMMVDLMNTIAEDQDIKVDIQAVPFEALIPSLQGGKIDIMSAAVTITPVRAEIVDFSIPIFPYTDAVIVKKDDNTEYKTAADFAGKTIGVQGGTAFYDYLEKLGGFAEIKTYTSIADIMRDVELGRIAAGFADEPIMLYRLSKNDAATIKIVATYKPFYVGQVALAVKKGNAELLAKLNAGIEKIKASGKLEELQTKWGLR